jgi:hypothetical protein
MVLRNEDIDAQPGLVPAPLSKASPPYPTTPLEDRPSVVPNFGDGAPYSPDLHTSPAFNFKTLGETQAHNAKQDEDSDLSEDEWNRSDDDFEEVNAKDVPDALRPAGGKAPMTANGLPAALKPGPPAGIPIKRAENISPMPTGASSGSFGGMSAVSEHSTGSAPLRTNNPYLKMQPTGQSSWGDETSQQIWGAPRGEATKYDEPVELPAFTSPITPSHDVANLRLDSNVPLATSAKSSSQVPLVAVNSPTPLSSPQFTQPTQDPISNPWNAGTDVTSHTDAFSGPYIGERQSQDGHAQWGGPQAWNNNEREGSYASQDAGFATKGSQYLEREHQHLEEMSSTNPFVSPQPPSALAEGQTPTLPPRRPHEEETSTMASQPLDMDPPLLSSPGPESPNTTMNRQRKEHYQIKHIRWHDVNKPGIRSSPILTQNLNGPCPLLALVNALILSTPAGIETSLIETLRTREQVSLGLLLDAVFDELMSGRRGTAAQELPDVSDLYRFLLALHTGLNVNPMFVPDADAPHHSTLTNSTGGFENTPDMQLYRTFNIPLMHGWLPESDSEAYAAFNRVAKSYETSQFVQFQEEELDAKLQSGDPLNEEEQQMFTDIHAIKEFLNRWPTQLTHFGLKVIQDRFQSGQVAILFRNDHFSTLFKDPRTNKLLTLVTDQGYSTHDEIVWESLVDVNGQGSELFSGDFRSVENNSAPVQHQSPQNQILLDANDGQHWPALQGSNSNQQPSPSAAGATSGNGVTSPPGLSRAEQEDHDLALALQLQEEEEDRERRDVAQRERDNTASVNAIAAHSQARPSNRRPSDGANPPIIPPRRNNVMTNRPATESAPPPTYEEASTSPAYVPPRGQ